MNKTMKVGLLGLVAVATIGLSACAPEQPAEEPKTETPEAETVVEEEPDTTAFGETFEINYAGSAWEITIDQPRDVAADLEKYYEGTGLDAPTADGGVYVGVPGTVTRVGDGPADPFSELDIEAIVNNKTILPDYQSVDIPSIMDVGELFPEGSTEFLEIFVVPVGETIETVSVTAGMGEASTRVFIGEPVDLGEPVAETEVASEGVESMQYVWGLASEEQKAESRKSWGLDDGSVTTEGIDQLIAEAGENGLVLTSAEGAEFLEWVLAQ